MINVYFLKPCKKALMAGKAIRKGDSTNHGGVIEGSELDIYHGKPIAYIGDKTMAANRLSCANVLKRSFP